MKELNNFRKFIQENELHEGTWGLGSPESIGSIIQGLDAIRKMADDAQNKKNAAGRGFIDGLKNQLKAEKWNTRLYNIVGDDEFHDAYDGAKAAAELNDFDEVKNRLGDAIMRAIELRTTILKNRGLEEDEDTGEAVDADYDLEESFIGDLATRIRKRKAAKKEKERFTKGLDMKDFRGKGPVDIEPEFTAGLEENDSVLDEVIEEGTIFDQIDDNLKLMAVHMTAEETLEDLVAEFTIISGGTKILAQALRNIVRDNKLTGNPEE